jgi:hypothetical protein
VRRALLLALLAAGCAARPPEAPNLEIEADRARVVLPARGDPPPARSRELSFEGTLVRAREGDVEVSLAGEDFSVVAEGGVRLRRRSGERLFEEGPYGVVILRNDRLLTR